MQRFISTLRKRVGLYLWTSADCRPGDGERGSYLELPYDIPEGLNVSLGISSLTVFCQGRAQLWQCRLGSHIPSSGWQRLQLPGNDGVRQVSCGLSHCLVCGTSGQAYSSGWGYFGQTGQSSFTDWNSLSKLKGLEGACVTQVVCGLDHSLFLLRDGRVFACGWSADGQTGTGSYESSGQLKQVDFGSSRIVSLATCSDSSFALTDRGETFGWGNNEYGQLGVASEEPQLALPKAVECSAMDGEVVSIAAGGPFSAFLTSQGSVYVAGYGISTEPGPPGVLRKLHSGEAGEQVVELDAGLNYLLARSGSAALIWGKLQLPGHASAMHQGTKLAVGPDSQLVCGPVGLAAITGSANFKLLSSN